MQAGCLPHNVAGRQDAYPTKWIGSWMTRVATSWLIYRLTGSAWLLGVLAFAGAGCRRHNRSE
jgi:hypothetical protein